MLEATNPRVGTLELDGVVYHTSPRTKYFNLKGKATRLRDLVPHKPRGLYTNADVTTVKFVARRVRGKWRLDRLRVVAQRPD